MGVISEISGGQEQKVEDESAGEDEGGLDFVKHCDSEEEEKYQEEKGGEESAGLGDQ